MSDKINIFDFVNSITYTKKEYTDTEIEQNYNPYITLKTIANYRDTVLIANIVNTLGIQLPKREHFRFLFHSIDKKKRYAKNVKREESLTTKLKIISEYYKCGTKRAEEYLEILSDDQINELLKRLNEHGGIIKTK